MKILLTAFEPFGEDILNSSMEVVKLVKDNIGQNEIVKLYLPVEFNTAGQLLHEAILKFNPSVVMCIGQAGGRKSITLEVVAINLQDANMSDNANYEPQDCKCRLDGENAYFTKLPVKKIMENINLNNISCDLSYSAGTYVCNDLMYSLLYDIDRQFNDVIGGFIHVPYINEQNKTPSMNKHDIVKAIEIAIETCTV